MMTRTDEEIQLIDGLWEILPNQTLAKVGEANISLIGPPPFTQEDQNFGKKISEVLKKMGIPEIEPPYYDTSLQHPDLSGRFPNVPLGKHSTDCGNVSWIVPLVQFSAATHCKQTIGHTWIQVAQNAMPPALTAGLTVSKWMAATALDIIVNKDILEAAWAEHKKYLAEIPYYHPVPKDLSIPTFFEMYGCEWESVPKPPSYFKE